MFSFTLISSIKIKYTKGLPSAIFFKELTDGLRFPEFQTLIIFEYNLIFFSN
jgi:hypothetical protein